MQTNQIELAAIRQTADVGAPLPAIVDQLTAVQVQIAEEICSQHLGDVPSRFQYPVAIYIKGA